MAVSRRYRRRIVVDGREFFWTLAPDRAWHYAHPVAREGDHILTVVSDDKSFKLYWAVDAARRHPDEGLQPLIIRKNYDRIALEAEGVPPRQVTPVLVARLIRVALAAMGG